jgi:hypothetical protein
MLKRLHEMGFRAEHAYTAGTASIGLAVLSWVLSRRLEGMGIDRADRWGIFVGEWAPTFFALGNGLRTYEMTKMLQDRFEQTTGMPAEATTPR